MANTTIKSTYSLDVETVRKLELMARRWNVSKSEALRRAIRAAAAQCAEDTDAVRALDELQATLRMDTDTAAEWESRVRAERRESGRLSGK